MITRTTRNFEQNANIRRNQRPLLPQCLRILTSFESSTRVILEFMVLVPLVPFLALTLHFIRHRPVNGDVFLFSILLFSTICSARPLDACQALHKPRARTISLEGNEEIHTQWQQGHMTSGRVVSPDVCLVRIIVYLRLIQQCEIWPWIWIGWATGGMK